MKLSKIPFTQIDWGKIRAGSVPGAAGEAAMRVHETGDIRIRIVEYSPGFRADHFCSKGHIVHLLRGDVTIVLADGRTIGIPEGSSFIVGDDIDAHCAESSGGATVLIVD